MEQRRLKVMLDTNVLIDVLCPEGRPNAAFSATVFRAIKEGKLEGEISTQSIIDAAYVASRTEGNQLTVFKQHVRELFDYVNIDGIDSFSIRTALEGTGPDFEDEAQYAHAYDTGCDVFLTGDRAFIRQHGGTNPNIQFFTPDEFVARLKE